MRRSIPVACTAVPLSAAAAATLTRGGGAGVIGRV